jgi:diacylglycerol kinase family enzyme
VRALIVVNPSATTTNARTRDVLVRALRSEVLVELAITRRRGHAAELARQAAEDKVDLVVALGGDGTVNEVVNGLLHAGPGPHVPDLGVVPGGSTNVFARALDLPRDPLEATATILDAVREGTRRSIGLGLADGRYFTFCAGLGFDAEVIRRVERARVQGRTATNTLYLRSTVAQFFTGPGRQPQITLERPDGTQLQGLTMLIVQNTAPWTYLGDRPLNPNPDASFDTGLDVLGMRALRLPSTLRVAQQVMSSSPDPHGKHVVRLHDQDSFRLTCAHPLPLQVDGDYLGERDEVLFRSEPDALRVLV